VGSLSTPSGCRSCKVIHWHASLEDRTDTGWEDEQYLLGATRKSLMACCSGSQFTWVVLEKGHKTGL